MKSYDYLSCPLYSLLKEVIKDLSENDVRQIIEFIEHSERGIAFETLCTQIVEYDIPLSLQFYEKATQVGLSMGIEPVYWLALKKLIQFEKLPGIHKGES